MSKPRWGDADDDEDVLPENTTTGPNEKGVLTKVEYYHNSAGEPIKKTTKIQLVKVQTRVYEVCAQSDVVKRNNNVFRRLLGLKAEMIGRLDTNIYPLL